MTGMLLWLRRHISWEERSDMQLSGTAHLNIDVATNGHRLTKGKLSFQSDLHHHLLHCHTDPLCGWGRADVMWAMRLHVTVQGGLGDIYKVWHLIWRHEHVHWFCCVETFCRLIPLWPTKVYTPPDCMSGLVSLAKQAIGCRTGLPKVVSYTIPAHYQLDGSLLSTG